MNIEVLLRMASIQFRQFGEQSLILGTIEFHVSHLLLVTILGFLLIRLTRIVTRRSTTYPWPYKCCTVWFAILSFLSMQIVSISNCLQVLSVVCARRLNSLFTFTFWRSIKDGYWVIRSMLISKRRNNIILARHGGSQKLQQHYYYYYDFE